jgi:hypothetical protein
MSSNSFHISRANYEEFFLLYIDNELSADERASVEAFATLHPDLGEELDLLRDTTLDVPSLSFGATDALLASSMAHLVVDESLLLYIDNELDRDARKVVELELAANPAFRAQHASVLQAKLDPADTIIFPGKSELYHREEDRRRPLLWLRIAAAVVIAAGIGSILAPSGGSSTGRPPAVAIATPRTSPARTNPEPASQTTATENNEPGLAEQPNRAQGPSMAVAGIVPPAADRKRLPAVKPSGGLTIPATVISGDVPADALAAGLDHASSTSTTTSSAPQQILNTDPVTSSPVAAYNMQNTANNPAAQSADNREDNGRQGSVRGLLRKATRFIERRTGIKSTDDEDRLLVGAVAIPLK